VEGTTIEAAGLTAAGAPPIVAYRLRMILNYNQESLSMRTLPGLPRTHLRPRWAVLAAAVLAASFVALPAHGRAQDQASLRGTLTTVEEGEPLAGATVELVELSQARRTSARGRYAFEGLVPGTYTLRFTLLGRATHERSVRVGAGETVVDVALEPEAIALNPLMVLLDRTRLAGGAASAIPGAVHVVTAAELEARPTAFDDVHGMLRGVPGVSVQEEDGYGLRPNIGMRGTGTERSSKITLLEDGVLIAPAPYAAPAAYYFPTAGRMEAIEVRKGSSQVKYGPRTVGGALNLVSTSIPDRFRIAGELAGGEQGTGKVHAIVGDSDRNFGWMAETYQIRTDGFKRLDVGGDTGFYLQDYVAKLRLNSDRNAPGLYHELELKLGYHDERSDETYLGLTEADFDADPLRRYAASQNDVMNTDHRQYQVRYFVQPTAAVDVTATLYRNEFARNWYKLDSVDGTGIAAILDDPVTFAPELAILRGGASGDDALVVRANNREYLSQGIQSALGVRFGLGGVANALEVGVRYHEDEEDRLQQQDGFRMEAGRMVATSEGAPGSQANRISGAEALAFYAQNRLDLGRLSLTPGIRFETIDFTRTDYAGDDPGRSAPTGVRENGVEAWIPGIGASFLAAPGVRLLAGIHEGFGPPGPGADDRTESESSVNYELGGRVQRDDFTAQVIGFRVDYDNILGAATLATGEEGSGRLFNGGAVDVQGVEVALDYEPRVRAPVGAFRLPLRLAYTFTDATFQTAFESDFEPWGTVEPGHELPYLARHQLFASAGVAFPRWSVHVSATHGSAMRTRAGQGDVPEGEGTDAFLVLGAIADYRVAPQAALFLGVENVTDERYVVARRPAGARPGLPRTIQAGVRIDAW